MTVLGCSGSLTGNRAGHRTESCSRVDRHLSTESRWDGSLSPVGRFRELRVLTFSKLFSRLVWREFSALWNCFSGLTSVSLCSSPFSRPWAPSPFSCPWAPSPFCSGAGFSPLVGSCSSCSPFCKDKNKTYTSTQRKIKIDPKVNCTLRTERKKEKWTF